MFNVGIQTAATMAFWADKYRPTDLAKVDVHSDMSKRLKRLIATGDFPHLLVYGPPGAGKRTQIDCILHELYGAGAAKLRIDKCSFDVPSGKKLEISMFCSNYHVVLSPSDVGIQDRVVIQEVIKKMAQTQQLDSSVQRRFKVIVLLGVDRLTRDAQHALRRTMEKYSTVCRLILCCSSCSKIIPPIQSRCLPIRVPAPDDNSVQRVLQKIASKEKQPLAEPMDSRLIKAAGGNLRRAILSFEAFCVHRGINSAENALLAPDWQLYIADTAKEIVEKHTPQSLLDIRERLFNLLTNCIPNHLILKTLLLELLPRCDDSFKHDVIKAAADCEVGMNNGTKPIYHLEAFVVEVMALLEQIARSRT